MIIARTFSDQIWNLEELMNAEKQILDESTTSSFVAGHDNISCVYFLGQHA